ncbi:uncharacterized protein LOC117121303 [Anneissia japonica]|uniref:uncharacterized protein LOC117121303 n=1 Tax=Anneissia japonica TaxID=1529436 RepID=UPI0014258D6F|nr:uncharacterized protein LOC117121303 [Anneissia japonica]XP_033122337.1 uncharacterized protein LOC117121303 [Anneissia japonica]
MDGVRFNVLKMVVARWYDENKYLSMLKVLYRDHVKLGKLTKLTNTMDLINDLVKSSYLSPSDLTILAETIALTKNYALQDIIKSTFLSFPDVNKGTISKTFTPYRQRLMEFGMALTPRDVTLINGIYNTPHKQYVDGWIMISDLEDQQIIKENHMDGFYKLLITNNLLHALKALQTDIPDTSLDLDTHLTLVSRSTSSDTPQVQEAYQIPDLSPSELNQLLEDVSTWWELYGNMNMLKVILSEFKSIPLILMAEEHQPRSLFEHLRRSGLISQSNVDIIIETVFLGFQRGLESKIRESIPTFPGFNETKITKFSNYRRNLLEFAKVMDAKNKERIGSLYNLYVPELKDQWILIFELEKVGVLTEGPHVKQAFVKKLEENGMIAEAKALNTFPESIPHETFLAGGFEAQ